MRIFCVTFLDRKELEVKMATGTDAREVWDRYHREYPYERIQVRVADRDPAYVLGGAYAGVHLPAKS